MFGRELLQNKIKETGIQKAAIMKKLNINSYSTFRTKVNAPEKFTASEIAMLTEVLNLTREDRDRIFFTIEVA